MNEHQFLTLCRDFACRLPATERAIIAMQIRRLIAGYDKYGPLSDRLRRMDLTRETAEEAADLLMYQAMQAHLERQPSPALPSPRGVWARLVAWFS